jgi:hypothetical protein
MAPNGCLFIPVFAPKSVRRKASDVPANVKKERRAIFMVCRIHDIMLLFVQ